MVRALLAGAMIAVVSPILGSFLIAKRYSIMSDSLAHVALAGIALGLFLGINPFLTALVVTLTSATLIEKVRSQQHISGELALAMFLSGGLALAVVLSGLGRGFNADLLSYLFGSITTVTETDLYIIGGLSGVIVSTLLFFYRPLQYISFDEEAAQVSGIPVKFLNMLLVALTALSVTLSLRIVGALLIGALMVIPVVTAMQLRRSFFQTILWAIGFSLLAVGLGLIAAFYLNLAAGGTIVLTALGLFGVVSLLRS
ncbi:MAG TPA: metal ABC transporter permease [Vitreimonas sp.]|nr:metal ABC transporter permease [Vitreimonas sp.]